MRLKYPILFLSQCLPYPPTSGVTNRTYHILEELCREFSVHLLAFNRQNHQSTSAKVKDATRAIEGLGVCVRGVWPIQSEVSVISKAYVHARSVLGARPYTYYDYCADSFRLVVGQVAQEVAPRLVHLDSLDLHRWIKDLPNVPVACTHHSIESDLLRLRAEHIRAWGLRAYLGYQARLVEGVERTACPRLATNVMMSAVDAERLRLLAPGSNTYVVPNGVDVAFLRPPSQEMDQQGAGVLFLGPSYMFPNRDGVQYFLDSIWPLVRASVPDARFTVVGRVGDAEKRNWENVSGVRCVGYVDDIRPVLASAACCVCPLRVGGGTRLKILDYWAMGRATVSTSVGAEGLLAVEGKNVLLRDEPVSFAGAVVEVLKNQELRQGLGEGARATAVSEYSWEGIGERLRTHYRRLIESGKVS